MKATHIWRLAAERDKRVGIVSVPGFRGAVLAAARHVPPPSPPPPLQEEDRVKPEANKPASLPALKNTG